MNNSLLIERVIGGVSIKSGVYEELISVALDEAIASDSEIEILTDNLQSSDSSTMLSRYSLKILEKGLKIIRKKYDNEGEGNGIPEQIAACNEIIQIIAQRTDDEDFLKQKISMDAKRLLSVKTKNALSRHAPRPETSLSMSSLFTGSKFEPQMVSELKKEILSSDKIDFLVSFIKNSGVSLLYEELVEFTKRGGHLRVITTTYMGATDPEAVLRLSKLPNVEVKISYDTKNTRHHAKSYIFYRNTGYDTAYVGSSNLSGVAISGGLEWNVKLTNVDTEHLLNGVKATFNSYWEARDFVPFDESEIDDLLSAVNRASIHKEGNQEYLFDIEPYPHQKEVLEELEAERTIHGRFRNLLVSATGTGKTVISAFDYKRFCKENPGKRNRLLFIAHREEILKQSRDRFRGVLRDQNFGELYFGDKVPTKFDHIFMSIQTFRSKKFETVTEKTDFDFIIVDETHHGAADSYRALLTYYEPKILLGMTATPERMDGLDIKEYFNGVIASEIRLAEAIDRSMLVPFQYFGAADEVDASSMRFENGKYNVSDLDEAYVGNLKRIGTIYDAISKYAPPLEKITGLGFCASQEHAYYMAEQFNNLGIPSAAVTSKSDKGMRTDSKVALEKGELKFIFTVDLYNEGVDIPKVNTVLFLRPTESLTVFIQQLGRGLRKFEDKEELIVLDFIGMANKKYSFERKFAALTSTGERSLALQLSNGFSDLPRGCFIQLEPKAMKAILENIAGAVLDKKAIMSQVEVFAVEVNKITFNGFLNRFQMTPQIFYEKAKSSFYELCSKAGVIKSDYLPDPIFTSSALSRIANIDSRRFIQTIRTALTTHLQIGNAEEKAILVLLYSVYSSGAASSKYTFLEDFIDGIKRNTYVRKEILELLDYTYEHINFVDKPVGLSFDNLLDIHCSYTRDQLLTAVGEFRFNKRYSHREGVCHPKNTNVDVLLVTLEKSEKHFSPTTLYEDYALTDRLFHWQSQSTTPETSETGQRYINHRKLKNDILLFVRIDKNKPYVCLGKANYVSHTGSKPMNIVWELEVPMPPMLFERARAVR